MPSDLHSPTRICQIVLSSRKIPSSELGMSRQHGHIISGTILVPFRVSYIFNICSYSLRSADSPSSYENAETRATLGAADRIVNEAQEIRADYLRTTGMAFITSEMRGELEALFLK